MKVVLQENGQQTREASDDIDSVEPDSDVPDGIPMPPPLFNRQRSPLDGTPWQHNVHAQQLLDKMNKPSKPMIGLPWKKVGQAYGCDSIVLFHHEIHVLLVFLIKNCQFKFDFMCLKRKITTTQ